MVAISLLAVVLIISLVAGSIGFLIGYFAGRRSGAKDRQSGFSVLPLSSGSTPDSNNPPPEPM